MDVDGPLYQAFLEELQALERFRISYSGLHPEAGLERDDPDVRRLIEAMAVLTARARLAGQKSAAKVATRLFTQQLPYLLSPTPALGLVQARPQPGFVQAEALEEGERMLVQGPPHRHDGRDVQHPEAVHQLLRPCQVLPIQLSAVRTVRSDGGRILYLDFTSQHRRGWQVEQLSLLVDHLSDLTASATVFRALRDHLSRATIAFDRTVQDGPGDHACQVAFGRPPAGRPGHELVGHPLQAARMFFRLPEQYMYLTVQLPEREEEWQSFTLCLELDAGWPRGLSVAKESLKLNVVPIANLVRELSDPIDCDGTQDRYRFVHPDPTAEQRPHSVVGVYRLDPEAGMVPLLPAATPGVPDDGGGTYEVEYEDAERGRRAWVVPDLPDAFDEPVQLVVDAFWFQPHLTRDRDVAEGIEPADRNLEGVQWRPIGPFRPPADSPLLGDDEALLDLLAIKNQPVLDRLGLSMLLETLTGREANFQRIVDAIASVEVAAAPFAHAASGLKQVYVIEFGPLDTQTVPLLDLLGPRLKDILHAWSSQEVVEVVLRVPTLDLELAYRAVEERA